MIKFNIQRFALLVKLDLATNYKTILTFTAATASLLFFYFLISPANNLTGNFHADLYSILLFVGGFWVSSLAFKELHDPEKNYIFLTLACSNLEKFLCKLLLTSLGYVLALSIGYFILSLIINVFNLLLLKQFQPLFNPLHQSILVHIYYYIILQSVFLLGSIYFKKHVMSKILLTISCFLIILFMFTTICARFFLELDTFSISPFVNYEHWFVLIPNFAKAIFWFYLAPLCWLVTYLRLTETEL